MRSTRWQWNDYRYCRENLKWVLTHFDGDTAQLRMLRRRLRCFSREPDDRASGALVHHFVYSLAYIERSSPFDPLSIALEKQAIDCLLNSGIKPPKSQLSPLFADVFKARIQTIKCALDTPVYPVSPSWTKWAI